MGDTFVSIFGRNVRKLRHDRGLSQEALAEAAHLDRSYIGGIERGERNPALKTILGLANALGVHPSVLFHDVQNDSELSSGLTVDERDNGVRIRFRYDRYDAKYDLDGATLPEFQEVMNTLRTGLTAPKGRSEAVAIAYLHAVRLWPKINPSDLWTFLINRAYCDRNNHPPRDSRLNLEQSWKRTSGWALERVLVRHYGPFLTDKGITLETGNKLKNKAWFKASKDPRLIPDKADILVTQQLRQKSSLIGVVHVKASLAERRTDDIPMSLALIEAGILSIFWTMDAKSFPSEIPINRGEFGPALSAEDNSEKRKDFEENGYFSACFSYNRNTVSTPKGRSARSRIYICNFQNPDDAFTRFLRRGASQFSS